MTEVFLENHNSQIITLARKFSSYFTTIDRNDVRAWLRQFHTEHLDVALKLLQFVDFYDTPRITNAYRTAHQQLLATIGSNSLDGITFFTFGRAGKSWDQMIYLYRNANDSIPLTKFKHYSEITSFFRGFDEDSEEHKLVFIDDFIGTGSQAMETWDRLCEIPFPRESQVFLVTLVGFGKAIDEIMENTDLRVVTPRYLSEENRVFSPENTVFDDTERDILRTYCESVGQGPMGFGNCQASVVFYYKAPDNVISILRGHTEDWTPLFPRRLIV